MTAVALSSAPPRLDLRSRGDTPRSWPRNGKPCCRWCMHRDPGGTARRVVPPVPCDVLPVRAPSWEPVQCLRMARAGRH